MNKNLPKVKIIKYFKYFKIKPFNWFFIFEYTQHFLIYLLTLAFFIQKRLVWLFFVITLIIWTSMNRLFQESLSFCYRTWQILLFIVSNYWHSVFTQHFIIRSLNAQNFLLKSKSWASGSVQLSYWPVRECE